MKVLRLILAWLLFYGPVGVIMYLITTFLFAFSGGQVRMVPVVNSGFLIVSAGVLIMGMISLIISQSLSKAIKSMLITTVFAWLLTWITYWILSFRL